MFPKAFELSSSEVEAAERLAKSFAKSGEWDLVEVVSQRVIESGKAKPAPGSKKKGFSWPFAALGVVQLNNQEYAKSIVSFQSALRTAPANYYCWVGLGESIKTLVDTLLPPKRSSRHRNSRPARRMTASRTTGFPNTCLPT